MKTTMALKRRPTAPGSATNPLGAMAGALAVGMAAALCVALLLGLRPLELLNALWEGAWGSKAATAATIAKMTPLILTGLAVSLAYSVGLLNIGCEGQLTLGALAAASAAVQLKSIPSPLLPIVVAAVGALVGGLWSAPAIWLKQKRGIHEVISTLLLNYMAVYLAEYLVLGPLGDGTTMGRTPLMPVNSLLKSIPEGMTTGLGPAPLTALALAGLSQLWLSTTVGGYEARAVQVNPEAARNAGIPVSTRQWQCFLAGGTIAGLAGSLEVMAVHHRFYSAFSPGYGFDGVTVAFLVGGSPGWLWLSAGLMAGLRASDKYLQLMLNVSPNVILVLQAILLLAVTCRAGSLPVHSSLDFLNIWTKKGRARFKILNRAKGRHGQHQGEGGPHRL